MQVRPRRAGLLPWRQLCRPASQEREAIDRSIYTYTFFHEYTLSRFHAFTHTCVHTYTRTYTYTHVRSAAAAVHWTSSPLLPPHACMRNMLMLQREENGSGFVGMG